MLKAKHAHFQESGHDELQEKEGKVEEGEGDERCEHCILEEAKDRAMRLRKLQERAMEDASLRSQKASVIARQEREQVLLLIALSSLARSNAPQLIADGGENSKSNARRR